MGGFFRNLFGSPKLPQLPAQKPLPTIEDPAVKKREEEERLARRRAGGRGNRRIVDALGDAAPQIERPEVLGRTARV